MLWPAEQLRQGGACPGIPECQVLSTKGQKILVHKPRISVGQSEAVSVHPDVAGAVLAPFHTHANCCMVMQSSSLLESVDIPPHTAPGAQAVAYSACVCTWSCSTCGMAQWPGVEKALNQGHRAEERRMSLNSAIKGPHQTA